MFYLLKYYKWGLAGVSVVMIAVGFLALFARFRQRGLKSLILEYRAQKKPCWIGPLLLTVLLLNCFLIPAAERLHTGAEITLNYYLASQGLNPNGSRFNQTDILNAQVLERAVEKGALEGISAEDLKATLKVRPAVQGDSLSEESYFISSQFVLEYNANRRTAHESGEKLLSLVTQAYREWFIEEYSACTDILNLDFTQREGQDYLDRCSFLKKTAESIGEYMLNMSNEEAAFRSSTNGETFQSLCSKAYAISTTMVEHVEAHVLENSVSKNADQYINRLRVANVFLDFEAQKAAASNENTLEAIAMYEDDMARIVLVPTYNLDKQFYMSQTRIGVDDFAASADSYANEKTALHARMAKNHHVMEQLSIRNSSGANEKTEKLIDQVEQELLRVARLAKELVEEYNTQQANNYMTLVVFTAESRSRFLALEIVALTALFGIGVLVCRFGFK